LACHPKLRRSNMEIVPLRQGFGGTTFALTELAAAGICTMREDWPANRSSAGATWKSSPYAKASGGQPSLLLNWQPRYLHYARRWLANRSSNRSEGWWSRWESNPRPLECHSSALPTELRPHNRQ